MDIRGIRGQFGVNGLKACLDEIYSKYNKRRYVRPDPLQFLYQYEEPSDQEVVGLLAASLAYGRVVTITEKVAQALQPLGKSPKDTLMAISYREMEGLYRGFVHRFHKGEDVARLLWNMKHLIREYGTLGEGLSSLVKAVRGDLIGGLGGWVERLVEGTKSPFVLPNPQKGSASKRLFLYLRWMVRKDDVDLGCWQGWISPRDLLVPLDTHLFRIGKALGFTRRRSPDLKAAKEVTDAFRELSPEDPVKYDFSLTRFGINPNFSKEELFCLLEKSP